VFGKFIRRGSNNHKYFIEDNNNRMKKMTSLANLGIFFVGLGILFASFGFFWWISLYEKVKFPNSKG
jgi:hypothetical protein